MADISPVTSLLMDWLLSPLLWFVLIFAFIAATFGFLWIRKRRKLIYDVLEVVLYKGQKAGFNLLKAGWFGKKKALKRWWDYGEEQVETRDGEKILNFSTEDFQEINGKRGIVVMRDPVNPDVLVPISSVSVSNGHLLAEIAPAEYRDAALDIINDADKETKDWTKQLVQWVLLGMLIVASLVSIIVIAQMVKNGQEEASKLILEAGKTCLDNAKEICQTIASTKPGESP